MPDLPIRCTCGAFRAVAREVTPRTVNRVSCHCRGCRAYAWVLRRTDTVDAYGGTEVFHMSPRQLEITQGHEHLDCIRVTDRGALRFFASCCATPIVHTLPSLRIPFMAVNHACVGWPASPSKADLVGPMRVRVNARLPRAQARRLRATPWALLRMLVHYVPMFFLWWLRGDARRSPLVDPATRQPLVAPRRVEAPMLDGATQDKASPVRWRPSRGCG